MVNGVRKSKEYAMRGSDARESKDRSGSGGNFELQKRRIRLRRELGRQGNIRQVPGIE
jgi:hypothetical protein